MKKLLTTVLVAVISMLGFSSCAAKSTENSSNTTDKTENMKTDGKKLVVFFSHTGENYNVGYIEKAIPTSLPI